MLFRSSTTLNDDTSITSTVNSASRFASESLSFPASTTGSRSVTVDPWSDLSSGFNSASGSRGNSPSRSTSNEADQLRFKLNQATALRIYEQVWNEYFTWEQDATDGYFASVTQPYETERPGNAENKRNDKEVLSAPVDIALFSSKHDERNLDDIDRKSVV